MTVLETLMRFSPPALALSLALLCVSSISYGKKRADHEIKPESTALVAQARTAHSAGKHDEALDKLESALAVDPLNREAYLVMAAVAKSQELPGKAIRLYREALLIEPNDVVALGGQGEALVQKGALTRAKDNLARITRICISVCPEQTRLAALIAKAEEQPTIAKADVLPAPVASAAGADAKPKN